MSMKRFGRGAIRIVQEFTQRARITPKDLPPLRRLDAVVRNVGAPKAKNPFLRVIQLIVRHNRAFVRPFSTLSHHRILQSRNGSDHKFNRFAFKKQLRDIGVIQRIKNVFGSNQRYNAALKEDSVPDSLDGYEIGGNIGYGCNAAVYALKLRTEDAISRGFSGDHGLALIPKPGDTELMKHCMKRFPLALKLMYNYALDETISEDHLWRNMGTELVPLSNSDKLIRGRMGNFRPLCSSHPNVVKMLTAFVDSMPILPDARERYPEALPSAAIYGYGMLVNEPQTMFVVMKRYNMTLRDYILTHEPDNWTGKVMLGQIMEGVAFLHDSIVAHRDMKSDNILLEFNDQADVPHVVISDFGCALATGSWKVHYRDSYTDMGGNLATRSPEVALAKPGANVWVNFEMADTWAVGTLAHEIFTRVNPFYLKIKNSSYKEEEDSIIDLTGYGQAVFYTQPGRKSNFPPIPPLSSGIDSVIRNLVKDMLRIDPKMRIKPHVAANAITLSLFKFGNDVQEFLEKCGLVNVCPDVLRGAASNALNKLGDTAERCLEDVLMLITAETIFSRQLSGSRISSAELQLRATFLSRLDGKDLWPAISYFFQKPVCPN